MGQTALLSVVTFQNMLEGTEPGTTFPLTFADVQAEATSPLKGWSLHMTMWILLAVLMAHVLPWSPTGRALLYLCAVELGRIIWGLKVAHCLKGQCEWCPWSHEKGAPSARGQGRPTIVIPEGQLSRQDNQEALSTCWLCSRGPCSQR